MKCEIFSLEKGAAVGSLELADSVFAGKVNKHLIYEAVKTELANQRQGNAETKERGDVNASNTKPYRQKGTGRARAGRRSSPIWVGGGTIFGPHVRSYKGRLPKKMRLQAMRSLLSSKVAANMVKIIEDFREDISKTKEMAIMLSRVSGGDRVFVILQPGQPLVKRAMRNIPWIKCFSSNQLVYKDLFYAREVLITKSALADLEKHYGVIKEGAE